jgi:hypothetical protein
MSGAMKHRAANAAAGVIQLSKGERGFVLVEELRL